MTKFYLYLISISLFAATVAPTNAFANDDITDDLTNIEQNNVTTSTDAESSKILCEECGIDIKLKTWWKQAWSPRVKLNKEGTPYVSSTSLDGWSNRSSSIISLLSLAALGVSLWGILSLSNDARRRKKSKECQKLSMLDLIRHFTINLMILEGVKKKKEEDMRPESGTFLRFTVLDSDLEFNRFYLNAKNFEDIHQLSLFIKNYNIHCSILEQHFANATRIKDNKILTDELTNLEERIRICIRRLWSVQKTILRKGSIFNHGRNKFVITETELIQYLINKHTINQDVNEDELKNINIPFINDLELLEQNFSKFDWDNVKASTKELYTTTYRKYCIWRMNKGMKFYDVLERV